MSKPKRRVAAVALTALLTVTLSACTQGHWVYDSPPAAGVQADEGGLKLRNFMVVSDPQGKGILLGGIASRDESTKVTGIQVAAQKPDGSAGTSQQIPFSADIYKGKTIYLDGTTTKFSDPQLQLGRLADVTVGFSTGETVTVEVPVMSSEHPDFSKAWAAANG